MNTFLEDLALEISKSKHQLDELTIVLPSERACSILRKNLSSIIKEPFWSPKIITILTFIESQSDLKKGDPLELLLLFYNTYLKVEDTPEPLEDFIHWAPNVISDFNEIDAYLVNTKAFFKDLRNLKELDEWEVSDWSLAQEPLSDNQVKYFQFWNKLGIYYNAFNKTIQTHSLSYQGKIYRDVAENISNKDLAFEKLIFAGFNALSKAEKTIIDFCEFSGAKVYEDKDPFYLLNPSHEAGMFFRQNKKQRSWTNNFFKTSQKNIHIIGAAKNTAQSKIASDLLQKHPTNTAVLLADEKNLEPFLNSASNIGLSLNVTMGLPIASNRITNTILSFLDIHERRFKGNQAGFYYKDFLKVISNGLFNNKAITKIKNDVIKFNYSFLYPKSIESFTKEHELALLPAIFNFDLKLDSNWINNTLELIEKISSQSNLSKEEKEILFLINDSVLKIEKLFENQDKKPSINTFKNLLKGDLSQKKISFLGDPFSGIQVMGTLESRSLDYENIIMLSVNEDVIPKKRNESSYIPYDLKKYYQLPGHKEKDAIYAYHFYRLLQRAKNVYLIYNNHPESLGGGEPSRFITQLEHELPIYNPEIKITKNNYQLNISNKAEEQEVENTPEIKEAIVAHLEHGLSPSAINTYLACPKNYYYKYILKLREDEEIEETIQHNSLGTFVHRVLEVLYTPYLNQYISTDHLEKMLVDYEDITYQEFLKEKKFTASDIKKGNNYLIFEAALSLMKKFLQKELADLKNGNQIKIIALEQSIEKCIPVDINGTEIPVKIKGNADRIDICNGVLRVIDYKTGKVESKEIKLSSDKIVIANEEYKFSKALQLLAYAYLFKKDYPTQELSAGNISLKTNNNEFLPLVFNNNKKITDEALEEFESIIKHLVHDMLNSKYFIHNPKSKYCNFC